MPPPFNAVLAGLAGECVLDRKPNTVRPANAKATARFINVQCAFSSQHHRYSFFSTVRSMR
jgi:hypothetical protein